MTLGVDPDVVPYDTNDATPDARLLVSEGDDWVRVPIVNDGVTTHLRKGSDVDIVRVTDAYVPREWQGSNIIQYIDAFDPDARSVYDRAQVQYYDSVREEYVTTHDGFVRSTGGTGSSESKDPEPSDVSMKVRILGPEEFLGVIPASETFRDASVQDVLVYVRDTFEESQPLYDDVPIVTRGNVEADAGVGEYVPPIPYTIDPREFFDDEGDLLNLFVDGPKPIRSPKTFTRNRDTLADVVGWLRDSSSAVVYFSSLRDGTTALVYDETPTTESFQAHNLGGNVEVRNNNALYQIGPRNALIYKGRSKSSLGAVGPFELTMPADKYPSVEVYHEPTVNRAGERYYGTVVEGQKTNLDEAEREARSRLKEILSGSGGGKIECDMTPILQPFNTLEATPACRGNVTTDVPSYTFEIDEVTHTVTASKGSRTDLRVGPHVATGDILVDKQSDDYGMKAK